MLRDLAGEPTKTIKAMVVLQDNLTFEQAMEAALEGKEVKRSGWEGWRIKVDSSPMENNKRIWAICMTYGIRKTDRAATDWQIVDYSQGGQDQ